MARAIILCGKIASGKTTYAQQLAGEGNAVLLSCDELMLTLFDHCLGEKHDETAGRCERYLHRLALRILATGADAILDFGYWTKREREEARVFFAEQGAACSLLYFRLPEQERIRRLEERNRRLAGAQGRVYVIDEPLRLRLDAKFEEPAPGEADEMIELL